MSYAHLHPSVEDLLRRWLKTPDTAAFLLVGPPGVGKTTLAREILKENGYRIVELNASHTRSGQAFKKQIIPLLTQKSVLEAMSPTSNKHKLAVLLDEIDGLSLGEKGGLSELLDYMRGWKAGQTTHPLLLICNEIKVLGSIRNSQPIFERTAHFRTSTEPTNPPPEILHWGIGEQNINIIIII
jgi:DNA polymerase III delta prime subunit